MYGRNSVYGVAGCGGLQRAGSPGLCSTAGIGIRLGGATRCARDSQQKAADFYLRSGATTLAGGHRVHARDDYASRAGGRDDCADSIAYQGQNNSHPGERISLSQADEIKFMKRWLAARNAPMSMAMPGMPDMDNSGKAMPAMPGMLTPQQMRELEKAEGAEFDRKFLTGMMQHHNGALVMVKQLFDTPGAGQDAELFDFATDVDNTQRAEIKIMEGMLKEKE